MIHQDSNDGGFEATWGVAGESTETSRISHPVSILLNTFGRISLMLTAVVAASTVGIPGKTAIAASHHGIYAGHAKSSLASLQHDRSAKPVHGKHTQPRSRMAADAKRHAGAARHSNSDHHPNPSRLANARRKNSAVRSAETMHRGALPLVNTTWDDPEVPPAVLDAIQSAARESGIDPHLLAAIAWRESRFDPNARSQQSSAKGLLQFTTGTWLQMVRDYGSQHNVADYAAAIHTDRSGDLVVSEQQMRDAILQLRNDPILSAKLAAENMMRQRTLMQVQLKRRVRPADLYLIHVLGPTGAARFLTAVAKHPKTSSLDVASLTVMRNAGLLARDGQPLSVADTYAATQSMLKAQHMHSAPLLTASKAPDKTASAMPIQVSETP